jgi:thiamine-phosphate pyrophosphorylase
VILHLVTDRRQLAPGAARSEALACVLEQARHAVGAGVDVMQIRERDLDAGELASLVTSVVEVARGSSTRVVVNDRVDVALATGATGVHLRGDSLDAQHVRAIAPPGFIIGRSVHSLEEARSAGPIDYLTAGTIWRTRSHPADWPLLGLAGLEAITRAVQVPVVAIGGVETDRFADIAAAGAAGVAGIRLFMAGDNGCRAQALGDVVQRFRAAFGV